MSQVVPVILGTIRTGILEGLASGTYWDVPIPPFLGTVRTEILEGLASGTRWDVLSSSRACWDQRTVRGNPVH